jgi:cytochrome c
MRGVARGDSRAILVVLIVLIGPAFAGDRATAAEAKALLTKAVAYYKSVGRQQALKDFNARKPPFTDRDLFVFCVGPDHTLVANGGFPELIGTQESALLDENGKSVLANVRHQVAATGEAVVRYRWVNPVNHNVESKVTFFAKAGDDICAVGAYTPR